MDAEYKQLQAELKMKDDHLRKVEQEVQVNILHQTLFMD